MIKTKFTINPITGELDLITRVEYKQVEIDFGSTPKFEKTFTIVDPFINPNSIMEGEIAFAATTGKDKDESTMDALCLRFSPGNGQFDLFISGLEGRVYGTFLVSYSAM